MTSITPILFTYIAGLKAHDVNQIAGTVADDLRFVTPAAKLGKLSTEKCPIPIHARETPMPLVIQDRDNRFCPIIFCDHCGQAISDAKDGNYQWRMGLNDTDFGSRIYFTHKRCCHPFEQAHKGNGFVWGAMELQCLPIYLGNNLALGWEAAQRHTDMLGFIE
jgi:hypothetical protein